MPTLQLTTIDISSRIYATPPNLIPVPIISIFSEHHLPQKAIAATF
ncbi:MAG: hypothetical protein ACHBN1_05950 [Heteroscytonema crispum UTEX LB 1556]